MCSFINFILFNTLALGFTVPEAQKRFWGAERGRQPYRHL
jgi:hypothetical protein